MMNKASIRKNTTHGPEGKDVAALLIALRNIAEIKSGTPNKKTLAAMRDADLGKTIKAKKMCKHCLKI